MNDARAELLAGLRQPQKMLSPKYFYDETGSQLFEQITAQPEYYPTRTELGILRVSAAEIGRALGPNVSLIEFGAGASIKVRVLLDANDNITVFVPVDISGDHLRDAVAELEADYPRVEILPVAADFTRPFELPTPKRTPDRNIVFFPGSTIGNFSPAAAAGLLRTMRGVAKAGGGLLIGVDLKKDATVLERAYNDAAGLTAQFNLNMLTHLNRRFEADFDVDRFRHRAIYNADAGRIEMHLVSLDRQQFRIAGESFELEDGESLLTECSYKYALDDFRQLAESAGFAVRQVWMDDDALFSVQYCESR